MINKIEKKLAISKNNLSRHPEKNLYLNYLFYLNGALFNYLTLQSYFKYKYEIKSIIHINSKKNK